jgi:hypothetical protein
MILDQDRETGVLSDDLEALRLELAKQKEIAAALKTDTDEKLALVREYIARTKANSKAERRKHAAEIKALRDEIAALEAKLRSAPPAGPVGRWMAKCRAKLRIWREMREVRRSGLFDGAWYLARYGDVARSGVDPLHHYLRYGGLEGRDPNPDFDSDWYSRTYASQIGTGVNPLLDYVRAGSTAGRDPSPYFCTSWYRREYPDVEKSGLDPLLHYQRIGRREGRAPVPMSR